MTCRLSAAWPIVGLALATTACSNLTGVATPDIVPSTTLNSAAGAATMRAGAIADFAESFSLQVTYSGLISDELSDRAGGFFSADQRRLVTFSFPNYPYDLLSQARIQSLRAVPLLQQFAAQPAWHVGELFAYEGFVETFFAEDMCSGVPLGVVVNETPAPGPTLSRNDLLRRALADFDSATVYGVGVDSILDLAAVGTARALLDSGDFAGAARAAAAVPSTYVFPAQYANTVSQINQLFEMMFAVPEMSVSDDEGQNGLPFISAADPRVPTVDVGPSLFGAGEVIGPLSATQPNSPITVASGVEARLIAAEAALPVHGGVGTAWLDTLNALRSTVPGLAPLSDPGSDSARVSLLFSERAFWLFLTGHRQGDMRRLIRQYGRPTESVFPTGPYYTGVPYGTATNFEPFAETGNPNFHGCLNTDP